MNIEFIQGDSLIELRKLKEKSINCCVTSPPYWGLRDYANKEQIGLENTYQEYIQNIVKVFAEVHRVLRDDGTLWLNLGDSYYNYRPGKGQQLIKQSFKNHNQDLPTECSRRGNRQANLKEKDLVGIPWRVALALQDWGWYLRQDIIWHKPNPMPESVKDRCTKAHEYIFLLTKSPKYYFDNEAIKEDAVAKNRIAGNKVPQKGTNQPFSETKQGLLKAQQKKYTKRNKRSVWTVSTKPFKQAHFAVFPPDLIEPCILAGCPENGIVLDPFGGAGTTGLVAENNKRNAILIELNDEYIEIAKNRIINIPLI